MHCIRSFRGYCHSVSVHALAVLFYVPYAFIIHKICGLMQNL
ncbi:hypothetical protein NBRC111894_3962 [Sporolactobacillus inulinus]|uniref:Uncharacterized protein n=1 Tax=Sporolactobacillus inulinus TaxID=2078 RepID=A0A4Y1ZJ62_9BACL|nr:hypothetical protein NBRC111894_3962 [Sporolactobacillus inulinus]